MGWDFRVESSWRTHPKFILIKQLYGSEGVEAIFTLWAFVTEERNKGVLTNMSDKKIAAACCIDPRLVDPSEFVSNLIDIGFLDRDGDGVVVVHNWKDRQPNVWGRGEKDPVKVAAGKARWNSDGKTSKSKTKKKQPVADVKAGAEQCLPSAEPQPTPSYLKSLSQAPDGAGVRELVFGLMSGAEPRGRPKSPDKWPAMLQGLLDDGRCLEDIERATRFALQDGFWRSRILSPKGFADNFAQLLDQSAKATEQDGQHTGEGASSGMSAEEWDAVKKQAKAPIDISCRVVNAVPP